ncbi:MAG: trypsin-like peptidase domain-containing protein [Candidatus Zixiibacteriota bacterium]|nr:MAG: trypsin-like peptidase domain-containing protein [candidate division Zixibacteria bacterium]
MNRRFFSPENRPTSTRQLLLVVSTAVIFVVVGLLIASNLDLSAPTVASDAAKQVIPGSLPLVEVDGEYQSPFVAVVETAQAAVVHVSAQSRMDYTPWWYHGSGYSTSAGSGFFFREDGYLLTNNHVVEDAENLRVTTASGYNYEATLVGTDPLTDLAVLKIEPEEEVAVIPFGDSDAIKVGDWAIAIGNPFPQQGLDRTVTVGVISAKGRSNLNFGRETPAYQNYIQTDASINVGNSGGPLLNIKGECIGVNAAISSPTGGSVGIGFAIPINLARAVVPDLIATGTVSRGWLGVWLGTLTEQEARRQGLDAVRGVKIDSVISGSPAARAGIRNGDIILSINDQPVENGSQLSVLVSQSRRGQPIPVEIVRDGERMTVTPVMGDRDAFLTALDGGRNSQDDFEVRNWLGMELMDFSAEVALALGMESEKGVYVRRIEPGSPADRASISRGTIILQVDKDIVASIDDIERIGRELSGSSRRIPLIVVEPDGTVARKVIRP